MTELPNTYSMYTEEMLGGQLKVLIIDSNKVSCVLYQRYLKGNSFEAEYILSSAMAMDYLKESVWQPDIILINAIMPTLDGMELTRQIKSYPQTKDIPVILIVPSNDSSYSSKALQCGANDFIAKPIEERVLAKKVDFVGGTIKIIKRLMANNEELISTIEKFQAEATLTKFTLDPQLNCL